MENEKKLKYSNFIKKIFIFVIYKAQIVAEKTVCETICLNTEVSLYSEITYSLL